MEYITEKKNINHPWKSGKKIIKGLEIDGHKIQKTNIKNIFVDEEGDYLDVILPKYKNSSSEVIVENSDLTQPISIELDQLEKYTISISKEKYRIKTQSLRY
jgi:hypothetical protein